MIYHQDLVAYSIAWRWQKNLVNQRLNRLQTPAIASHSGEEVWKDTLILLEHPPVYTLGQGSQTAFVKFDVTDPAYELYRIERGGEVTYHCPGQLVGYPILDLRHYQQDLHWYLRQLEEVLIRTVEAFGLVGERIPGLTGVWIEGRKVAAIGIKVSRWITMHGFALNVCPDLSGFQQIVPCGITDKPVGSLAQFIPSIALTDVRPQVVTAFAEVFNVQPIEVWYPAIAESGDPEED